MTNPNPERITNEMWRLWEEESRIIPGVKNSGIYANKKAYHNTVIANLENWPGNYSIKLPLDLVSYNRDKARANDLTMSDSEMVKWTSRMKKSAEDPNDNRLAAVREFYGTLDNKTVFGLIKDDENGPWRRSSSDSSHLWHGHKSIFTAFVANWNMLSPILSVEKGETLQEWKDSMFPKKNDVSEEVRYWQFVHNNVRTLYTPPLPELVVDNAYGDATEAAFTAFAKKNGAANNYLASRMTAWLAIKYNAAFALRVVPKPTPPSVPPEMIKELVNAYLDTHIPNGLAIKGTIVGDVILP